MSRRRARRRAPRLTLAPPRAATVDAPLFDWAGLMRAGLGQLGLLPREFWALTPFELRVMLGLEVHAPALTRARLEELAARFPDRMKGREDG
jgi:uncharacterized phage protein (TIGR02216 family)